MNISLMMLPQELIDAAFSRGRKAANQYPKQKTKFYTLKGKEIAKIDAIANYVEEKLFNSVKEFPSFDKMEPFYKDLSECITDTNELRKHLSKISSVARIIKKLRREAIVKLKELNYEKTANKKAFSISRAFLGRVSSTINSLKEPINYYNDSARKLRELPSIKTSEACIILAGFPNVGKSTLLSKLTDSKPKIANYPFTTKGLNVGLIRKQHIPIQVIDTPGLLDRPLLKRNKIELKAITALQHLKGMIVFVVDPNYDLNKQKNLFIELKKLFTKQHFLIVSTKADISKKEVIEEVKKEFKEFEVIIEGNNLNNLKEKILSKELKI